ncbi:MAG TPA: 6-phosphofructokinase [Desulfobulbaceae bacterium]|nr:6-phosphofructokinase [Desulfobulbaceae bacterium]
MIKHIGVLTAGGDSPGLNAAIRGIGKGAALAGNIQVIGFRDGFRGFMENRFIRLQGDTLVNILTLGGTILGTNRDKPHKMPVGGKVMDMTDVLLDNYRRHHLDALICIGGGGTHKNALRLSQKGMNIITLPKTIDNDVAMTDVTLGFDTAMEIATSAIDRLHSTAHSHHRIIVVEVMGHNAGWLALGAGIASGADVILIPEIPFSVAKVAQAIQQRMHRGKNFSIVVVAEGALSDTASAEKEEHEAKPGKETRKEEKLKKICNSLAQYSVHGNINTLRLSSQLEELTGLESRITILGHLQRGGTPSAADRVLATRLGTACIRAIEQKQFGVMVAARGESTELFPLAEVVGLRKTVPPDHPWVTSARMIGTCLGD